MKKAIIILVNSRKIFGITRICNENCINIGYKRSKYLKFHISGDKRLNFIEDDIEIL